MMFSLKSSTLLAKLLFVFMALIFIRCKTDTVNNSYNIEIPSYIYKNSEFQVVGHRGYADIYPENTLLSIEEAFKRGVKYCEIDVNLTSDDVYVLFHDQPTMYRTSSSTGYVVASTYQELLQHDFGAWKGEQFKSTKVATLEEALILAEKYDAYLYLDTKKNRLDLMGKALEKTKVSPKRLLPAISSIEEAKAFKGHCPESSFIYFGGMPEDPNNDNWYKTFIDLGCEIFETYYTYALENNDDFKTFVDKVHEHGAKVWVFTSNDIDEIKTIKKHNVDGVESDLSASALKALYYDTSLKIKPLKATTGNWTFNNNDLQSTGVGSQLRPFNYSGDSIQELTYGTVSSFGIQPIDDQDAPIVKIPAFTPDNGLFAFTNFTPYQQENLHYEYSLLMDVYLPKESEGKFVSLFQTSPKNSNDGDLFISSKGIGVNNDYQGKIEVETWYRLSIVVSKTSIKKYLNGKFVGQQAISGGRWSVYNTFSGGQNQGFLLFADENNETAPLYVNAIQLRNYSMNSNEIASLAGPNSNGIAISNTGIYDFKVENEVKASIVNWDSNQVYVFLPNQAKDSKLEVQFKTPYGSKSSVKSGDTLNLSNLDETIITVTAQDGITKTNWTIVPVF